MASVTPEKYWSCESLETMLEHQMTREDLDLQGMRADKTARILRVFNYYRVVLSFALLLLFLEVPGQQLVGTEYPQIFQSAIVLYIATNTLVSFLCLVLNATIVSRTMFLLTILTVDVIFLSVLLYTSGGVQSGLANFLIFPAAYSGVLIRGRTSVFVAAVAVILAYYSELNIMMHSGDIDASSTFSIGVLGLVLFAVNVFFQYLTTQLRKREDQVDELERLNQVQRLADERKSQLDHSNRQFEILLDCAGDGVLGLGLNGKITFANPSAAQLLQMPREQLKGKYISDFASLGEKPNASSFQSSHILHNLEVLSRTPSRQPAWKRTNGEEFPVDYSCRATTDNQNNVTGAVVVFTDITERRRLEQKLRKLANFDVLTGLANRSHFHTRLEKATARSRQHDENLAVMLLDLDHFKLINDQFGHSAGDDVFKTVAKRISQCTRNSDLAARLGGDEFALILQDFGSTRNLSNIAKLLIEQIAQPIDSEGRQLDIRASVGIAIHDGSETTSGDLMKWADTALYAAKADGRNTFRFFRPEMLLEAEATQRIQVALQNAISRDELSMNYQPIVSLKNPDEIVRFEALLRWNLRHEDPISPDLFIPIAEETGKIIEIGGWVAKDVVRQIREWHNKNGFFSHVAINVSAKQLSTDKLRKQMLKLLSDMEIPPKAIELELTETSVMKHPEAVIEELVAFHDLGFQITIDDFGTGHSSLDYLKRLPIDGLKIDKSFISGIGREGPDQDIIRVIVAIAKTMKLKVVAEGIETDEQLQFLRDLGVHYGQGYLFSAPLDRYEVAKRLASQDRTISDRKVTPFRRSVAPGSAVPKS